MSQESESASSVATARWNGIDPEAVNTASAASVTVENISKLSMNVETMLRCAGLSNHELTLSFGTYALAPGQSVIFDIPADTIPIQPIVGTGHMKVYVLAHVETPSGVRTERLSTVPLYYRYMNGSTQVSLFTSKILKSQLGGIIDGRADGEPAEDELVGRVSNGKGGFKEVRHTNSTDSKASDDSTEYAEITTAKVGPHTTEEIALEEETMRAIAEELAKEQVK